MLNWLRREHIGLIAGTMLVLAQGSTAFAQQLDLRTPRERKDVAKPPPAARPKPATACAEYGAGFVRLEGGGGCVKIGGGVDVGVGGSAR